MELVPDRDGLREARNDEYMLQATGGGLTEADTQPSTSTGPRITFTSAALMIGALLLFWYVYRKLK